MSDLIDISRGPFEPITPRMQSRFSMQDDGPLRPGKTRRDHDSGAWYRRLQNRRARGEAQR